MTVIINLLRKMMKVYLNDREIQTSRELVTYLDGILGYAKDDDYSFVGQSCCRKKYFQR